MSEIPSNQSIINEININYTRKSHGQDIPVPHNFVF